MNDTERQRLDATEAALRELTRRLTAMEQGEFHPGGEGFRIGTLRLFEKLSGDLYHLHQRDEDGAENDLTDALSIQGTPVSDTAPTAAYVLVYNASTGQWEPSASSTPGAHVLATTAGLGPSHTTSGLTAGQVLRATAAAAAAFQALQDSDIPSTICRDSELATHAGAADPHTGYQKESEREAASGYAGLDASSKVIKDPANATATPTASKIPIAGAGGKLAAGWIQEVLAYADLTDDPYADHSARHENAGADEISLAGLSGVLADDQPSDHATPIAAHAGAADPHTGYQKESEKDAASGYAGLDATPKLTVAQIRGLRESGGQALDMGAVADGEYLKRSGTGLVGDTPAGAGGATVALDNLAAVAINESLISDADSTDDLGSAAKYWANVYADNLYLNATAMLGGGTAGQVTLTGNLDVSANIAAGSDAAVNGGKILNIDGELTPHPCMAGYLRVLGTAAAGAQVTVGVGGAAIQRGTPAAGFAYGLNYSAIQGSASAMNVLAGIYAIIQSEAGGTGAITDAYGIHLGAAIWAGANPTTTTGIFVQDQGDAATTNIYGIHVTDQTATTITRLLEIGPATPYLRLVGGADPAANQTNLYFKVGAALKHVQVWNDGVRDQLIVV